MNMPKRTQLLLACSLLTLCLAGGCAPQMYGKGYRKASRGCDCKRLKIIGFEKDPAIRSLDIPVHLYALDTAPIRSAHM